MSQLDSLKEIVYKRLSDLNSENERLHKEIENLIDAGQNLYEALGYFTNNFDFMNEEEGFSQEKAVVKKWRSLLED